MPNYCSPDRTVKLKDTAKTCLTRKELQMIAQDYNITFPEQPIPVNTTKDKLYDHIRQRLSSLCTHGGEHCWIEQTFIQGTTKQALQRNYRPPKPLAWYKNKHTWLNTFDILDVMKQYELLHKDFSFMGVFPIDFQQTYPGDSDRCIGKDMCNFNIQEHLLAKGKKRFALVLNLDRHHEPGSHWVALYANLNPKRENFGIYYYDSVSTPPSEEVTSFMKSVATQINHPDFELGYNQIQKQMKNSECGVFSMVFLTQMLKQQYPFDFICQHMKKDDEMNDIRDILYRPSKRQ